MRIGKIIKNLKNFGRLRTEDKKWLAENKAILFEFVKNHSIKEISSVRPLPKVGLNILKLRLKPMPIVIGVIIAALLAGGSTVYASQSSLPGDALYPIKLLSEDAQTVLTFNSEKKVELEARFANRRLEEIQKLRERIQKKNGEILPEIVERAMERAEQRLERAQERIAQMEEGQRESKSLEAVSRLEEALQIHQQILSDLAGEVPTLNERTLLHAQEVASKYSAQALEKILKLEKAKEVNERIREKIKEKAPRIRGAEERAEGKLNAIENRLEALENFIENLEAQGKEVSEYEAKLDEAKAKVEEAKKLLEEEKYLEAFDAANAAMRLLMETKLLLRPILMPQSLPFEGRQVPRPAPASLPSKQTILPVPEPIEPTLQPIEPTVLPVFNAESEINE